MDYRKNALEKIKKLHTHCSCGAKLEHWVEGESICPVYKETLYTDHKITPEDGLKMYEEHAGHCGWGGELDIYQALMEIFEFTEDELKI